MEQFLKTYWKTLLFFAVIGLLGGFFVGLYVLDSYPPELQQQLIAELEKEGLGQFSPDLVMAVISALQAAGYGFVLGAVYHSRDVHIETNSVLLGYPSPHFKRIKSHRHTIAHFRGVGGVSQVTLTVYLYKIRFCILANGSDVLFVKGFTYDRTIARMRMKVTVHSPKAISSVFPFCFHFVVSFQGENTFSANKHTKQSIHIKNRMQQHFAVL